MALEMANREGNSSLQFPIVIVFGGMPIYQPSQAILGKKDTMMLHGANCIKDHRFFLK